MKFPYGSVPDHKGFYRRFSASFSPQRRQHRSSATSRREKGRTRGRYPKKSPSMSEQPKNGYACPNGIPPFFHKTRPTARMTGAAATYVLLCNIRLFVLCPIHTAFFISQFILPPPAPCRSAGKSGGYFPGGKAFRRSMGIYNISVLS